jgi:hypothetical protein
VAALGICAPTSVRTAPSRSPEALPSGQSVRAKLGVAHLPSGRPSLRLVTRNDGRTGAEETQILSTALITVLAVETGVVVIVVAIAVLLVVLLVTLSMRARQKGAAEARRDLGEAHERAGRAERDRDITQTPAEPPRTDPDQ